MINATSKLPQNELLIFWSIDLSELLIMPTNAYSSFESFEIKLPYSVTITGLKIVPTATAPALRYKPLVVMFHGGGCTAHHFDASPALTASITSQALGVLVVSINRPGYLGSTALPPDYLERTNFHENLGHFQHKHLLPTIWREFVIPNQCTALVLLAHSLGSPGIIIAASLHAQESKSFADSSLYPLAGIIYPGWGFLETKENLVFPKSAKEHVKWKQLIMCGFPEKNCVSSDVWNLVKSQDHPMHQNETLEVRTWLWKSYWRNYSDQVTVPVMFAQAEHDLFFEGSWAQVEEISSSFPKSRRFDGNVIHGAPHAIEYSWMAQGWYAACFGFAIQVTTDYGLRSSGSNCEDEHTN